ncbi:hypothetical protein BDN71DRAFT_1453396 [Pleurotus eryngii]|uniref:Uncharacterized protein n=1 Tax=Pleurotus eryngii TaxID=5323 RepID=A0A9P5ZRM1_PLEER|nr:hypothetical protein BDN71DRAFT_1453396 [Pleurotus eryngii]
MVWLDYFVAPAVSAARTTTSPIGAIVGGIVGGFALLLLMLAFFLRHRRHQHETPEDVPEDVGPETHDMRGHPFQVLQSSSPAATPRLGVFSASPLSRLSSILEAPIDNKAYASERSRGLEPQQLGKRRHHAVRQLPTPPSG